MTSDLTAVDLRPLICPRTVAVLGASATRTNNGNVVVVNLRAAGYAGRGGRRRGSGHAVMPSLRLVHASSWLSSTCRFSSDGRIGAGHLDSV